MKERPIIFNDAMVRAILDGRKTQTRRAVQGVRYWGDDYDKRWRPHVIGPNSSGEFTWWDGPSYGPSCYHTAHCPFGQPGDRLWVRECFLGWWKTADQSLSHVAAYRADGYELEPGERWTPSIHMPRLASRITLKITGLRVERLNTISEADAEAEGVQMECDEKGLRCWVDYLWPGTRITLSARDSFASLWQSIYGAESWQSNPWAWVIEFKRIDSNSKQI